MDRLRDIARRLAEFATTFFDTFVRENRVLPPVAALLALFLFAWVVAGALLDEPGDGGRTSGEADLVQSRDPAEPAPEVEDRDADSYAAYRNKDPFRQLLAPAETTSEETTDSSDDGSTTTDDPGGSDPEETTAGAPPGGNTGTPGNNPNPGAGNPGGAPGNATSRNDSDGDGIPNRREERLGLDPRDPDSDADGIEDGEDDSDGDGVPDGRPNRPGAGGGAGGAGAGGGGTGADDDTGGTGGDDAGSDDELFDSGGGYAP